MIERLLKLALIYIQHLNREKVLRRGEAIASLLRSLKYRKDVVFKNLEIAFPDKDKKWKEKIYSETLLNMGRNLAEFFKIPQYYKTGEIKHIFSINEGKGILDKYKGKGAILVTAHLGNWEIAGSGLVSSGYKITALAYRQKNKNVNSFIEEIRTNSGVDIIYHDQSLKKFLKVLNEGNFIAFLVDQNALRHRGVFVDFFGLKASTVSFPAKLAIKYKKPVIFTYCIFDEKTKKYSFFAKEISYTGDNVENLVQLYTKAVENAVKQYPGQYLWTHKRWKTRPEGEKEFY
ncbi:MAG: lipid A biosynthesis acyltransferase [Aquificota bacterium]|nr:MAG: lipid A biosynthesis acyltransferase [Aquificota bacterium]